jgi:hypothetical protein
MTRKEEIMEKLFDVNTVKEFWTNGFEVADRCTQVAKTTWDTQLAAAQQATIEAVNKSFDAVREATRLADEQSRQAADHVRQAWAKFPAVGA